MMKHFLLIVGLLFVGSIYVAAQEEEAEERKASKIEMSGFVDVYFQSNFNGKTPDNVTTSFTDYNNAFSLGMAKLALSKEVGKVSFGVDLGFGPRADAANGFGGTSFGPVQQMYVAYAPNDKITLTAGNFGTHVGYEVIDAPANFNYSTSYMFSYGPFYHTGLKADVALTDNVGAMVGIFNDTDNKFDELSGKHIGAQLSYSGDANDVYLNYLGGKDGADSTFFNQVDLTAIFGLSDALSLGVNATIKSINDERDNSSASWSGAALYLNYAANESLGLGLRAEYFNDMEGAIFGVQDLNIIDLTVSANISIDDLTIIPEFRIDIASKEVFDNVDGDFLGVSPTFILAAIYSF